MLDLLLYNPDGTEALAPAGPPAPAVGGAARALQRAAYELLLEPDSVAGRDAGGLFALALIGAGSGLDLVSAFSAAADQVLHRMAAEAAPPDERLVGLYLGRLVLGPDAVTLGLHAVTAAAGTAVTTLTLPVAAAY